jgi:hypothetical protein
MANCHKLVIVHFAQKYVSVLNCGTKGGNSKLVCAAIYSGSLGSYSHEPSYLKRMDEKLRSHKFYAKII